MQRRDEHVSQAALELSLRDLAFADKTGQMEAGHFSRMNDVSTGKLSHPSARQSSIDESRNLPCVHVQDTIPRNSANHKAGRRRPNQAQRRQMSFETSMAMNSQNINHARVPAPNSPLHERSTLNSDLIGEMIQPGATESSFREQTQWWPNHPGVGQSAAYAPKRSQSHHITRQQADWLPRAPHLQNSRSHGQAPQQTHPRHSFGPIQKQITLLTDLCYRVVSQSEATRTDIAQKESFRQKVEQICRLTIERHEIESNGSIPFSKSSVELRCFGSLASGFATKQSDLDLGLFSPLSASRPDAEGSPIPRLVEKALLAEGYGARLLSRARVPIIKLCERPTNNLRAALVAERCNWERSSTIDKMESVEKSDRKPPTSVGHMRRPDTAAGALRQSETGDLAQSSRDEDSTGHSFAMRQGPDLTLIAFYHQVKAELRRVGGRDVTTHNMHAFSSSDWDTLNHACKMLICGLQDHKLRQRLEQYRSLSFASYENEPHNRSLAGVWIQIEGERAVHDWENFTGEKRYLDTEDQVQPAMKSWRQLQQRPDYGVDPPAYNKLLQLALDRIQGHPAIRLMGLTQHAQETPTQYFLKLKRIILDAGYNEAEFWSHTRGHLVSQYVRGIHDDKTRTAIQSITAPSQNHICLEEVGQMHKCTQLANDFEDAIQNGVYEPEVNTDIISYIKVLRSPLTEVETTQHRGFIIPAQGETIQLLTRIRTLSDPRGSSVNQSRGSHKAALEFPSTGIGIQCDMNFAAHLALQNTQLLRCYSLTDPRVRPMVIFVKEWAKVRDINSGYHGTLSSYGFVLMVLHYLVNIANPFVCPNLQHLAPHPTIDRASVDTQGTPTWQTDNVPFWHDEAEIARFAACNSLTYNTETVGGLLRGFFEYFAYNGPLSRGFGRGFDWGREVLSLRSHGGLLTKQEKGWTSAKTVFEKSKSRSELDGPRDSSAEHIKEVKHRYLLSIEDPFELDHNVGRTVTHNGIVSIRDEFRRAWRIIKKSGAAGWSEELLANTTNVETGPNSLMELMEEIHGPRELWAPT